MAKFISFLTLLNLLKPNEPFENKDHRGSTMFADSRERNAFILLLSVAPAPAPVDPEHLKTINWNSPFLPGKIGHWNPTWNHGYSQHTSSCACFDITATGYRLMMQKYENDRPYSFNESRCNETACPALPAQLYYLAVSQHQKESLRHRNVTKIHSWLITVARG